MPWPIGARSLVARLSTRWKLAACGVSVGVGVGDDFGRLSPFVSAVANVRTTRPASSQAECEAIPSTIGSMGLAQPRDRSANQAAAGLPADYQTVPILNFRNIASETYEDQDLTLLDTIYANTAAQAGSFLSQTELAAFQSFRTNAISIGRNVLNVNRQMMAPISQ